jgi:hypothetical protein
MQGEAPETCDFLHPLNVFTSTSCNQFVWFVRKLCMPKKARPPASIGAQLPTLGEQFGRLEDRIQKIGGQSLPRLKAPRAR